MMQRRGFLGLFAGGLVLGQGVATRQARPLPRGKRSGLPWNSKLVDVSRQAGLREPVIYGGVDRKEYILETIGCGVAFIDYDNDGWLDLFLPGGRRLDGTAPHATNRLYRNNRDGTFTDVTDKAGLRRQVWAGGITIADYNNDGFDDIFLACYGQNILFRNNGDGTFTDVTKQAGLLDENDKRYGAGCAWVDFDRDGHLDLFVSNYVGFDFARTPKPGAGASCKWKDVPVNCGPRGLPQGRHSLYRNQGDGTFKEVTREAGIAASPGGYGMTVVAFDADGDGWPDIYVACDSTASLLFRNNHDGTFTEEGLERGIAVNEDGTEQAGMGVAVGDFDSDGHLDLFKTHFIEDTHILYRNDGKGQFLDRTNPSGLGVETRFVGWGAGFADLDNDGHPDVFAVTGSVYPEVAAKLPAFPYATPRLLFRNLGDGRLEQLFDEGGPGLMEPHSSRGCAFGDFDNDGDVDMLIMNMNEAPSLLRNDVTGGARWLKVLLEGVKCNRSAVGSRVIVRAGGRAQAQEAMASGSFYSANDKRLHFGLGASKAADVEVRWLGGAVEKFAAVPANVLVRIREGKGIEVRKLPLLS